MSRKSLILAFLLYLAAGVTFESSAQSPIGEWIEKLFGGKDSTTIMEGHPDLAELTVDENLLIPELTPRQQKKVVIQQENEIKRLKQSHANMRITTLRNDEVIHITIPASQLFAPNSTELLTTADGILRSLLPCLRTPDYYHMLLVMHSDNTGNEEYCYALTTERVYAVYDWLEQNGGCIDYVVPYAAGSFEPLKPNNSIEGRAQNRRLEIYLIPAEAMIEKK